MEKVLSRNESRYRRKRRIRKKIFGTPEKPRVCIYKSNRYLYVQAIDDINGKTITSASTLESNLKEKFGNKSYNIKSVEVAKLLGNIIGERLKEKEIEKIVFDRSGYPYHGRVKAIAEGIREKGIIF
ncbi:MAG: 50S ribosomal protein L18 [Candidatus Aminicenantia bacterium]